MRISDWSSDLCSSDLLGHARSHPVGKLRVAVHSAIGRSALIPNLAAFEARYPDIRLELTMRDYHFELNDDGFVCAIRMGALAASSLIERQLGYFNHRLLAYHDYLRQFGKPQHIA